MDLNAILLAVIASAPGIYAVITQLRRDKVDSAKLALDYAQQANERSEKLQTDLEELQTQFAVCKKDLEECINKVNGNKPKTRPRGQ